MVYNRAQLKQDVRLSMKGTASKPILVTLLFSVVVSVGTWLINMLLGWLLTGGVSSVSDTALYYMQRGYEAEEAVYIALLELFRMGPGALFGAVVGGAVLSVLVALWQGAMNVGYEGYCLSMVRNENPPMGKIFEALPQFGPVLVTRLLTGLFMFLWGLLLVLGYVVLMVAAGLLAAFTESVFLTMIAMLAIVAALVLGVVWVSMRYVLVDYVLLDKGLYGMEAIRENKRLMQGNIGRAFQLQLSFMGWYLLMFVMVYAGIILAVIPIVGSMAVNSTGGMIAASGVGLLILAVVAIGTTVLMLWLKPYVTGSMAKFYDWARGAADGLHSGPGFGGGAGGWSQPTDYTWSSGAGSGNGIGTGRSSGNGGSPNPPPKPPKPRDDPWN